ncbi:hypothetical protein CIB84_015203 [Bambusicola thoracicus]|uniref:Uncharacterized protein n=1 Tax=Bambusicola thoracicus TaxID=9083 RepID=A0A2P4SAB4_BAMTH|nr:hypothetical protein CIB84_015203 [Bambusicola thoracicus]
MPTSAASPASPPVGTPVLSSTPHLWSSPSQAPSSTPSLRMNQGALLVLVAPMEEAAPMEAAAPWA